MKSGFVAILGRPNSGKSTLLNALTGEKVAIVSTKPQTTRNRIAGVVEVPARKGSHPAAQIVFVDTPGVHKPASQLDRSMLQEVYEALETRDLVLVLMDATRRVQLEAASQLSESPAKNADQADPAKGTGFSPYLNQAGSTEALQAAEKLVRAVGPGLVGRGFNPDTNEPVESTGALAPEVSLSGFSLAVPPVSSASVSASASVAPRRDRPNWSSEDEFLFGLIRKLDCPVFLLLTKIDLVPKDRLLPLIDTLTRQYNFAQIIPVSARKRDGLDLLVRKIVEVLPTGERYYPKDQYTDQPQRFMVAELIRESILVETGEEVPYAAAVVIEQFEEPAPAPPRKRPNDKDPSLGTPRKKNAAPARLPLTRIAAAIYCERDGQKAILIGKGGSKLKEIGARARRQIESLLGTRVYLELHVIVEPRWRESKSFVESLDWRNQLQRLAGNQITEKQLGKDE